MVEKKKKHSSYTQSFTCTYISFISVSFFCVVSLRVLRVCVWECVGVCAAQRGVCKQGVGTGKGESGACVVQAWGETVPHDIARKGRFNPLFRIFSFIW